MAQNEQVQALFTVDADTKPLETALDSTIKKLEETGATGSKILRQITSAAKRTAIDIAAAGDPIEKLSLRAASSGLSAQERTAAQSVIETLRKQREELQKTNGALSKGGIAFNEYGLSVKQTAAALRQVPAQFTDIFVSLQGGQAPLTVLLQQGGQLKDVFGGIIPAAQALGSYILRLVNPFTVAAAAAATLGFAFFQTRKETEEFNKSLILSNNIVGTTIGDLNELARSVSDSSNKITRGQAAEFIASIAGSSKIALDQIGKLTKAALEFEAVGGGAAKEVTKNFIDLAKEPTKTSVALTQSLNYLTFEQYKQIKLLEDQGKAVEAGRLAQQLYREEIERLTPKLEANLGTISRLLSFIKQDGLEVFNLIKNLTRVPTETEVAASLRRQASFLEANPNPNFTAEQNKERVRSLEAQAAALEKNAKAEQEAAKANAERIKKDNESIETSERRKNSIESETAGIKAKILAAELEIKLLAQRGLEAEKILPSEKELLTLQEKLKVETNAETKELLQQKILLQQKLVLLEKAGQFLKTELKTAQDLKKEEEKQDEEARKREAQIIRRISGRVRQRAGEFDNIFFASATDAQKYEIELRKLATLQEEWNRLKFNEADITQVVLERQKQLFEQYTVTGQITKELSQVFSSSLEDAIISGKKFSDILKQIEQDILRIITRQLVTKPFEQALGDIAFSFLGGTQSPAPISIAGTRAAGGPVGGNMTYLVGEEGPELFVPSTSGSIIPNDQMSSISGSTSVNVSNVFYLANATDMRTQQQIAAQTGMSVQRAMVRNT